MQDETLTKELMSHPMIVVPRDLRHWAIHDFWLSDEVIDHQKSLESVDTANWFVHVEPGIRVLISDLDVRRGQLNSDRKEAEEAISDAIRALYCCASRFESTEAKPRTWWRRVTNI